MNDVEFKEHFDFMTRIIKERDSFYKRGLELSHKRCQSEDIVEIATAFATAQGEFGPITKSSQGYNYKYATLEIVLDTIRPTLNKFGLSIRQFTDENHILYTRLTHSSGQWFESRIKMRESEGEGKRSAEQAYGSLQTYMRRYQLLALLGVQPGGEDTDGV